MCFDEHGLVDTFTCLYDQKPVWLLPIVFLSTDRAPPLVAPLSPRDPPDVVFQRETVAIRAHVGHSNASSSSVWRKGAPQVVRASDHNFLHNTQLCCLVLCHQPTCFVCSVEGPFRGLYFSPENAFCILSSLHFSWR